MGKFVEIEEVMDIDEYNKRRDEIRKRIMKIKEQRRLSVGNLFTFLFENKDTVWYQIQEMIRIESIRSREGILHEVKTYNELIPNEGQIKATLLIEIDDVEMRRFKLRELLGLHEHVYLVFNRENYEKKIKADFDDRQFNRERISSVQYITFQIDREDFQHFLNADTIGIQVTHPAYYYSGYANLDQIKAIQEDFRNTLS